MKKILTAVLTIALVFSVTACGKKDSDIDKNVPTQKVDTVKPNDSNTNSSSTDSENLGTPEQKNDSKTEQPVQAQKPTAKPSKSDNVQTSQSTNKPTVKTEVKTEPNPVVKPESKPAVKPESKPTESPEVSAPTTLGNKLLAEFRSKAPSSDITAIAKSLINNPEIQFSAITEKIDPGLLPGFGNTEINGFKNGVTFAPIIGSIPFVGYIFELNTVSDVPAFISKLRANANLRWNICVEADEMITGSVGTKVFFVMCPTSLDD